jgi:hypothetical protein
MHREVYNRNPTKKLQRARSLARQLMRGERILHSGNHHTGMAKLKEWMGDPRPEGMQLSLVRGGSPNAYWGRSRRETPQRLSTNPMDYAWETCAENIARKGRAMQSHQLCRSDKHKRRTGAMHPHRRSAEGARSTAAKDRNYNPMPRLYAAWLASRRTS